MYKQLVEEWSIRVNSVKVCILGCHLCHENNNSSHRTCKSFVFMLHSYPASHDSGSTTYMYSRHEHINAYLDLGCHGYPIKRVHIRLSAPPSHEQLP